MFAVMCCFKEIRKPILDKEPIIYSLLLYFDQPGSVLDFNVKRFSIAKVKPKTHNVAAHGSESCPGHIPHMSLS